ncbi:MAG: HIT family protein [Stagnimonas sp.]|nr:HIT family protein [Stagnimonas sp.]
MNPTALKFGYPQSLIAESEHWLLLLRPRQVTLGSLVLVCKEPVQAFGAVSPEAFGGLQRMIAGTEQLLKGFVDYQRINYLMLMMVDPEVHFHVIPRYDGCKTWAGLEFADAGWPNPPLLASGLEPEPPLRAQLAGELARRWQQAHGA